MYQRPRLLKKLWSYNNKLSMTNINTFQGTVGIGTNAPAISILDVDGTLRVGDGTSGLIHLGRSGTVANYRTGLIYHDGTDLKISNQEDGDLKLATNNDNKLIIDSSGNFDITGYIRHIGDENNLFGFSGTDIFKIATAGTDALTVNSIQETTLGGNLLIPSYVYHAGGDNNTFFGFPSNDTFKIQTAGVDRLTINSSGDTTLAGHLYIPDYIKHAGGDNDCYFGFSANDTFKVITSNASRLEVSSAGVVSTPYNFKTTGGVAISGYNDITNAQLIFDFGSRFRLFSDGDDRLMFSTAGGNGTLAATTAIGMNGVNVGIGTPSPSYKLHVNGMTYASDGFVNHRQQFTINPNTVTTVYTTPNGAQGWIYVMGNDYIYGAARFSYKAGWSGFYFSSLANDRLTTWQNNGQNIWVKHGRPAYRNIVARSIHLGSY
jgi:hypothetical protein